MSSTPQPDQEQESGFRRFLPPWWTWLIPAAVLLATAGWVAASAESARVEAFVRGLLWPGSAAFLAAALMVWLGWVLEID